MKCYKNTNFRILINSQDLKFPKTFAQKADILYFCSWKTNWISNF